MQKYSSLGKGWLGPMSHVKHNDETFRLYDIEKSSSSLREDLHIREEFFLDITHSSFPKLVFIDENSVGTPYRPAI